MSDKQKLTPHLKSFAEIKFKTWQWEWHGWVIKGALNLFCGEGGAGKTSFALSYLHNQVMGEELPIHSPKGTERYGTKGHGKKMIYIGDDDRYSSKPKGILRFLQTEEDKVFFPSKLATDHKNIAKVKVKDFNLTAHTKRLLEYLAGNKKRRKNIEGIIIDPITPLTATKNPFDSVAVREKLDFLRSFTQVTDITVIGIAHVPKGHMRSAVSDMMGGSTALRDLSRNVLGFIRCNSNYPDSSVCVKVKTNHASLKGGWLYKCEKLPVEGCKDDFGNYVEDIRYVDFSSMEEIKGYPVDIRNKYCMEISTEEDLKHLQKVNKTNLCAKIILEYISETGLKSLFYSKVFEIVQSKEPNMPDDAVFRGIKKAGGEPDGMIAGKKKVIFRKAKIKAKANDGDQDLPPVPF